MPIYPAPLDLKCYIFPVIPSQSFMSLGHQDFSMVRTTAGQTGIIYPVCFTRKILAGFWVVQSEFLGLKSSQGIYLMQSLTS